MIELVPIIVLFAITNSMFGLKEAPKKMVDDVESSNFLKNRLNCFSNAVFSQVSAITDDMVINPTQRYGFFGDSLKFFHQA